jgi:hypothetical protein
MARPEGENPNLPVDAEAFPPKRGLGKPPVPLKKK